MSAVELGIRVRELFEEFLALYSSAQPPTPAADSSGVGSDVDAPRDYIEQCRQMKNDDRTTLYVDYHHIDDANPELADAIAADYYYLDPFLADALRNVVHREFPNYSVDDKDFRVCFYNMDAVLAVRELRSERVGRLVSFSGTVTRTSEVRPELTTGVFACEECGAVSDPVGQQFKYCEPLKCKNATCPNANKWRLLRSPGESRFTDWQRLRVQENATEIPAGSMPRTLDVILRGDVVERAKAGDRCIFTGTLIVVPDVAQLAAPGERLEIVSKVDTSNPTDGVQGLRALGARELTHRTAFLACSVQPAEVQAGFVNIRDDSEEAVLDSFSAAEKDLIEAMKTTPGIYDRLARSVAPAIFGHDEIKRGILLMLFGGVHKQSPDDGTRLRGDINCCLVGDPSTAKSNFLKYVCSILPRAVYASGKASTAAGLTATVSKDDETGEFCIEAGALMLADNGVCCIDEFDKMEAHDQVAIHEAMEQQTISIAKAGIQATLNARASILAAANPHDGRYDRRKTLKQNLNLTPAIMSRFDLFFVVLDEQDEAADQAIASHIVALHQSGDLASMATQPDYSTSEVQRYIRYARSLTPVLADDATELLVASYKSLRRGDQSDPGSYRVTVRQLEAMIRLSEARARVELSQVITARHVKEALRLLKSSIMHVAHDSVDMYDDGPDLDEDDLFEQVDDAVQAAAAAAAPPAQDETQAAAAAETQDETQTGAAETQDYSAASRPSRLEGTRRVSSISYEKFQRIARSLVLYIRNQEEAAETERSGMRQGDVVNWYLNQQEELDSIQALADERKLVQRVIQRLINVDNQLVVVHDAPPAAEGEPSDARAREDERILTVRDEYVE